MHCICKKAHTSVDLIAGDPPAPAAQIQPAPAALPSEASAPYKGLPKHFILPIAKLVSLLGR